MKYQDAAQVLARVLPPEKHQACYECGEVYRATDLLVEAIRAGLVNEAQLAKLRPRRQYRNAGAGWAEAVAG